MDLLSIDQVRLNFSEQNIAYLNFCLAFIMFGVALKLDFTDFQRVFRAPKPALAGLLSQFICLPILTYLLVLVIQPLPSIALGMMMVAACPGGNISNFMSQTAGGNTALSVSLTACSSLLAVIFTPLNLTLWASLYPPTNELVTTVDLSFWQLLKTITLLLVVPLTLGMLLRKYSAALADRLHPYLHVTSLLIFAGIIILAFSANIDLFLTYFHFVVWLVFVHNAFALTLGFQIAKAFGLALIDRRTLAIETGIQNSGLGLILIFTFFDGLGGMAIIAAWWGIWHIISGLGLAYFWSKRPLAAASI